MVGNWSDIDYASIPVRWLNLFVNGNHQEICFRDLGLLEQHFNTQLALEIPAASRLFLGGPWILLGCS